MRKGQEMKRFVEVCLLGSALFVFTGCQPRAEQAPSSPIVAEEPAPRPVVAEEPAPRDPRDLGVLQSGGEPASHLHVHRSRFSFEGGSHYLTDTATGTVWAFTRGVWKQLPPLPAAE